MKQLLVSIAIVFASVLTVTGQNHSFSLSGKWNFQIDREDAGMKEQWFNKSLDESINLPGSMPEKLKGDNVTARTQWTGSLYDSSYYFNPYMEKYRIEGKVKLPFFLTPDKHYAGVAWYQKKVTIPSDWKGERILLFLERPHIETTVWVNTKEIGMQNSLCVPHVYDLTSAVTPGKPCRITIRVDNRIKEINVGPDSHSITDQTQGNWNGIVGKIELQDRGRHDDGVAEHARRTFRAVAPPVRQQHVRTVGQGPQFLPRLGLLLLRGHLFVECRPAQVCRFDGPQHRHARQ